MHTQTNLFQLQTELIDRKIEMVVNDNVAEFNKKIAEVLEQITSLRNEMHQEISSLRHEMNSRLIVVETKLGLRNEIQREVRTRLFDYGFKGGWLVLGSIITYVMLHAQIVIH